MSQPECVRITAVMPAGREATVADGLERELSYSL